jgi:HSP20 family molecular chaperone IbpA
MAAERKRKKPVNEDIEPVTDIADLGTYFCVTAELPEVVEEKIRVDLDGTFLTIFASHDGKRYKKTIVIPGEVRFGKKKFRHGVLHIILEKNMT